MPSKPINDPQPPQVKIDIPAEGMMFAPITVDMIDEEGLPKIPQPRYASDAEIAAVKSLNPKEVEKQRHKRGLGRKTIWETVVQPELAKITDLYANGATLDQIAMYFGINASTFKVICTKYVELKHALNDAKTQRLRKLSGKVWQLAMGATETRVIDRIKYDKKTGEPINIDGGKHYIMERRILPPNLPALKYLLSYFYGWNEGSQSNAFKMLSEEERQAEKEIAEKEFQKIVKEKFKFDLMKDVREAKQNRKPNAYEVSDETIEENGC